MRPRPLLSLGALLTGLLLACGGTTAPGTRLVVGDDVDTEAGVDAPPGDARAEATSGDAGSGSDGGCISPTVGEACTAGESACQPHDPCCAGYMWTCDSSGTWQQTGLGCACQAVPDAGPFACGDKTCLEGTYCTAQPPGIVAADGGMIATAYTCVPVPAGCASAPTCACIESTLPSFDACSTKSPGVTCDSDPAGHVTVHCIGE
jgi:hypothetical protein